MIHFPMKLTKWVKFNKRHVGKTTKNIAASVKFNTARSIHYIVHRLKKRARLRKKNPYAVL